MLEYHIPQLLLLWTPAVLSCTMITYKIRRKLIIFSTMFLFNLIFHERTVKKTIPFFGNLGSVIGVPECCFILNKFFHFTYINRF